MPSPKRSLARSLGAALVQANVANIRQTLGHRSLANTAVYTQPTDEMAGKAVIAALASL